MMMNPHDDMLDDLFAMARGEKPVPGDDLVARVLADADAIQPGVVTAATTSQKGLWPRLLEAVGGWPAISGLAAATVAGIWVGIAPPSSVEDMTASWIGDEVHVSLFSADLMLDEGALPDG
ncbi:hypothetical protein BC777_3026 [Yoonia maricola]|uniref:Dihydroorotate dehydrogenase n=1 Tax=Yoonia maricola TaxID=420999 RepID=A0A2M8W2A1_9RHOB|nr:hypothetical protein [Yoonia maricola]PJI85030.1 hypothetical protein BC777_3026 [Yoonia maricola]